MRRTYTRDPARHNLAPLRHERVQHLHIFVIDIVDLLDAEPAYFLAPEILLLLSRNRFIAARGPLRGAAWSSFRFSHYATSPPFGRPGMGPPGASVNAAASAGCAGAGVAGDRKSTRLN